MLKRTSVVGVLFGVGLLLAQASQAQSAAESNRGPQLRYRYVSLVETLPEEFLAFDPAGITNSGNVCGTTITCDDVECINLVACFTKGRWVTLGEGFASSTNEKGIVGGAVIDDVGFPRSALFERGRPPVVLPGLPGELGSQVLDVNDKGVALAVSFDDVSATFYLVERGRVSVVPLDPNVTEQLQLNDHGFISGTLRDPADANRAFRLNTRSNDITILEPIRNDPHSWGMGINDKGDVLGYSFTFNALERVGVWRGERFQTYFVEGTPEFPNVSNRLLFNEDGLIVITDNSDDVNDGPIDLNSYLVPRPNVRVALADVASDVPPWTYVVDLNDCGDLVGYSGSDRFSFEDVFVAESLTAKGNCKK